MSVHGSPHKGGQYHENDDFSNAQGSAFYNKRGLFDSASNDFLHHSQHIYFSYFGYKNHSLHPLDDLLVQKEALWQEHHHQQVLPNLDGDTYKTIT
jgi:hypothetical protein